MALTQTLIQKINNTTMEFHFAEQVTSEYGHGHITRGGPEESIRIQNLQMIGKHENDCPAKSVQSKFKNKQKKMEYFLVYVFFRSFSRRKKILNAQIEY